MIFVQVKIFNITFHNSWPGHILVAWVSLLSVNVTFSDHNHLGLVFLMLHIILSMWVYLIARRWVGLQTL